MRFVDEVTIEVESGAGGNGCVAFRREKHVPRGGPAGGDGGDGGDVVLRADPALATLLDHRYQRHYRAKRGEHGQGHDRHGKNAETLVIRVPCGTLVLDPAGKCLGDLVDPGQELVVGRGGRGGKGNAHFTSSVNRAPRQAEPGEPGERFELRLELKLLADVGLVGFPNAGKSTLIGKVSAAKAKVGDYPFTTTVPNLGLVRLAEDRSFVLADLPGLIEGAHLGSGLGTRFLKHIERTRVLVFLLDDRHGFEGTDGDALTDLTLLRHELRAFNAALLQKPSLIVLNKIDALSRERRRAIEKLLESSEGPFLGISAVSGEGIPGFLEQAWGLLDASRHRDPAE